MRLSDDIPARVMAAHAAVACLDDEHRAIDRMVKQDGCIVGPDTLRAARLNERVGDVNRALLYGNVGIEDELLKVVVTALGWIDAIEKDRR